MDVNNLLLSREQMESIHNATLRTLEKTGLRVDCADYYKYLVSAGAQVNLETHVVKFPEKMIIDTIEYLRNQILSGRRQFLLNGVTNSRWTSPPGCKFGGACIEYLDFEKDEIRFPTEKDLIKLLQLGEALPDVGFVGNPVACLLDSCGKSIP